MRYNHDGVVFLNKKNEEKWIQPTQLQTPVIVVKDDVFAVADSGGNSILVFTKNGLKGENRSIESGNCQCNFER